MKNEKKQQYQREIQNDSIGISGNNKFQSANILDSQGDGFAQDFSLFVKYLKRKFFFHKK